MTRDAAITALVVKWQQTGDDIAASLRTWMSSEQHNQLQALANIHHGHAKELADTLSALGGKETPRKANACINCGEADDGGFEIGNENESFVGPFCSTCWEYVNKHSAALGGRPETGWQPTGHVFAICPECRWRTRDDRPPQHRDGCSRPAPTRWVDERETPVTPPPLQEQP